MSGEQKTALLDPYAILKVDRDASDAMIQSSYKNLSRTFHPDKQPPGPSRDAAQEVFVKFKNAHEILTDPVLRQVYDDHGNEAIRMVKMNMHSTDAEALYPTLLRFHQLGQKKKAKYYIAAALEHARIERADHAIQIRTTMEFPCSMQSTLDIPELSEASISVSASAASDSKWDMTVATSTSVNNGKGSASGTINVGYKPQQGTQISSSVDLSNPMKFSLGTTRTLANRTVVTTTARTLPNSNTMALSVVSHRDLWHSQLRGTWALGIGSDLAMHYGLLSLTTLSGDYPTCTFKLNMGINQYPIKITAKQDFEGDTRTGYASFAWGPTGMEWKAIITRSLTSYAHLSMGIKHATQSGLVWLLQAERGDFTFRVPISICSITSPGYMYKLIYLSMITYLFDEVIGEIIHDSTKDLLRTENSETVDVDMGTQKTKEDAEQQLILMGPVAERNMEREKQCNGLNIYEARYCVDPGQSVDVTTQLQFWVKNGTLRLPTGSKSHLMGFYKLLQPSPKRRHVWWLPSRFANDFPDETPVPQLRVRYSFGDNTYEITIEDTDELVLPNSSATLLGAKDRVR